MHISFSHPNGFILYIMQVTARTSKQPLDSMTTETHFTTITRPSDISDFPEGGRYIHGLFLEGAERERRRRELVPREREREGEGGAAMCMSCVW